MTQTTALLSRATAAVILGFALCMGAVVRAQEPVPVEPQEPSKVPVEPAEPAPPSPPTQPRPRNSPSKVTSDSRNVNVEVTVTQQLGGEPVSKTLAFVVADSSTGMVRSGIEVPVASGMPAGVKYRDVGFNVDAGVRILDKGEIWLDLSLRFSSVLPAKSSSRDSEANYPSFTNAHSELNLVLENGKPVTFTESADPSTGQQYSVQVKATINE